MPNTFHGAVLWIASYGGNSYDGLSSSGVDDQDLARLRDTNVDVLARLRGGTTAFKSMVLRQYSHRYIYAGLRIPLERHGGDAVKVG